MRLIIQRVAHASVTINGKVKSSIGKGLLILVGIEDADDTTDAEWLCKKVANLRIFDDENGVMNLSVKDIDGEILIISQFTLFASTKKETARRISELPSPLMPYRCMKHSADISVKKPGKKREAENSEPI